MSVAARRKIATAQTLAEAQAKIKYQPRTMSQPPSLQCNSLTDSVGSHRRTIGSNRVSRMDAGRLPAAREFRRDAERQEPLQVLRE